VTYAPVIEALAIPGDARVDQRVPKKLLVENGAPTAADKRQINDGIEELLWLAALKPSTIGVPAYRDDTCEYCEIQVLALTLRADAKTSRLAELVHRAIPYPVFLILSQPAALSLSLAHIRWSQGHAGQTVLDRPLVTASVGDSDATGGIFIASLALADQPRRDLRALYQGWIERFEAYAAARHTGRFAPAADAGAAERRRAALVDHERLMGEIAVLRTRAAKEKQLNRRVELNLQVKQLESRLADAAHNF
jgi:hypothetical protein